MTVKIYSSFVRTGPFSGSLGVDIWVRMMSSEYLMASRRTLCRKWLQERPLILKKVRFSSFLGNHDPREPTIRGKQDRTAGIFLFFVCGLLQDWMGHRKERRHRGRWFDN